VANVTVSVPEGVAQLRAGLIGKDFDVIPVHKELAVMSADIRQEYAVPMADSIIAATALNSEQSA
jgi:predicted nucleic acid-binding protein